MGGRRAPRNAPASAARRECSSLRFLQGPIDSTISSGQSNRPRMKDGIMRIFLALASAALMLAACSQETAGTGGPGPAAPGPASFSLADGVLDPAVTVKSMHISRLDAVEGSIRVYVYVLRLADPRIGFAYCIMALYEGKDWIFIPRGSTLSFEFEGRRIDLSGDGSRENRKVLDSDEARETAYYPVGLDDLRALASAKDVAVNLHGIRGRLRAGSLAELRECLDAWAVGQ